MPRANRYHLPGLIWHITHRCHNRDFLFKSSVDRNNYRHWLYEARKRYQLCLLNYNITSNHIHLIAFDSGDADIIERSMQFAQGRIAQQYNRKNNCHGAFWQDRYHATAIQSGKHLRRCMTYVDMNMVRAGAVTHPSDWAPSGYHEIQKPRNRCRLLDLEKLMELLGLSSHTELVEWQNAGILQAKAIPLNREAIWTEAVAVGDISYLSNVARRLGMRARHKKIVQLRDGAILEETSGCYRPFSTVFSPV